MEIIRLSTRSEIRQHPPPLHPHPHPPLFADIQIYPHSEDEFNITYNFTAMWSAGTFISRLYKTKKYIEKGRVFIMSTNLFH